MSFSESAHLTREEMIEIRGEQAKTFIRSRFNFLKVHNGLQKGELHLVVAPPGGAKSTFVRSIIVDLIQTTRCYLYLSEEPARKYVFSINEAYDSATAGLEEKREKFMDNLRVTSEVDLRDDLKKIKSIFEIWVTELKNSKAEVFILDNVTTSFLYGANVAVQGEIIQALKKMANQLNIAVVVVVHTEKGTTLKKGLFNSENVRGNAMTALMGSYIYVITKIVVENQTRVYVTIDKARYHAEANKKVYLFNFEPGINLYTQDQEASVKDLIGFVKELNDLGQPEKKKKGTTWTQGY